MNVITAISSAGAGACFILGLVHLMLWFRDRKAVCSLIYAFIAFGAIIHVYIELLMMFTSSTDVFVTSMKWSHIGSFLVIVCTIIFVRIYFGKGRLWLGGIAIGLRIITFVLNFFVFGSGINYLSVSRLDFIKVFDVRMSIPGEAVLNPWMLLAQSTFIFWFAFVLDATISCWLNGTKEQKRRALTIGGTLSLFILLGPGQAVLALNRFIRFPMLPSFPFILTTLAMGYELSREVLQAARISRDLKDTEQRLDLAATSAKIALWEWQVNQDQIWVSNSAKELFDMPGSSSVGFDLFAKTLHPDDKDRVMAIIRKSAEENLTFATEYRRIAPDGQIRWIAGRGKAEFDPITTIRLLRGVSVDITDQKQAETSLQQEREKLLHMTRVSTLSQMASFLAHELNQPLTAIINNAGTIRVLALRNNTETPAGFIESLDDIIRDGHRAGDIIHGIRGLVKRGDRSRTAISPNAILATVMPMVEPEARMRGCHIAFEHAPDLPLVTANPVQLQQVMLNILLNAVDAATSPHSNSTRIIVRTENRNDNSAVIIVRDFGPGLPADNPGKIFAEFYSTKSNGIGMGLSIVQTIIASHAGTIHASNATDGEGGACFVITLPACNPAKENKTRPAARPDPSFQDRGNEPQAL